ncbi:cytolethal distending toxin subunit A, partial [Campylobacter coli]
MQKIKLSLMFLIVTIIFSACSSKEQQINHLGRSYGKFNDNDPLKLGSKPTP